MRNLLFYLVTALVLAAGCRKADKSDNIYRFYAGKRSGYEIWIVDGAMIRNSIYPSFLYGGNEQRYPFVPAGEIWIDNVVSCEEFEMTVAHEQNERHLMAKFGWSYDRAHDSSLAIEVVMRRKFMKTCTGHEDSLKKISVTDYSNTKEIQDIPDSIFLRNIYRVPLGKREGLSVWIVDGYLVRKTIYPDFGFSGNDMSCHFIPSGELWIDGQVSSEETELSIATELKERQLMKAGKSYHDAYSEAIASSQIIRSMMKTLTLHHHYKGGADSVTRDYGIKNYKEK